MSHTNLTVYGATWCGDCKRAKKFLGEQRVHYNWVDVEQDPDGLALVERVNQGRRIIPTIVFEDGSLLVEPSNAELAGVFVFIGLSPNSGWLPDEIKRDQYGFVVTDATLATSLRGVFAAGDVRKGSTKQAAAAAGEGATAALMIREYLKEV